MRVAAAAVLAVLLVAPASGAEPRSPRAREAFFGTVMAVAPPGATRAELYVGDVRVRSVDVVRRTVTLRVPRGPGPYDLRIRFTDGRRLVRRDEAIGTWLLPRAGDVLRRERRRDPRLSARLGRLAAAYPGWAAVWTHDLRTGVTAGWNSDASFPAASTVKLALLVAALQRYGPRPERSSAWPLIRDLATWSSNVASNRLLVLLGGSEAGGTAVVNGTLERLGATSSYFTGNYRIESGPAPHGDAPKPLPVLTFRRTTAHDLGRILVEIHGTAVGNRLAARRTGLSRHEARVALGLLLSAAGGENAGLLRSFTHHPLARKEGWTSKLRHTAAIAYTQTGPRIVVVLTFHPTEVDERASRLLGRRVIWTIGV
ncbi:MAG: serine hydrolase [Pseudomonadota bacterium]